MTIEKRNKLEDGEAYSQAETALCIWEHVLESTYENPGRPARKELYNWMTQEQGVYNGRMNAINLAYLVDYAYDKANGEEYCLDGPAFDWELVPFMINAWSERLDHPEDVDIEEADKMAILLLATFGGQRG